ncbi:sulfotransferase domain-containing protein [Parvularcula dongshanensis]|uniref:Aryl sulfotransferase n=1 Tax=Parvularcula dongshanensis TaxID=1173995 RepID=A0A840I311_9PROT|nr:sulfotransferase domain-containing protein [Parvularcula dongshanensis]MBB4658671.1 aryl sulfotransferase [Parvularcula dongshanensis]
MAETHVWPRKTRELQNHHMDSTIWNRFAFRPDDVIVATYAKSGTTWTQQIVGQVLFRGDPDICVPELSPWVDMRLPLEAEKMALLGAQAHRRFLKTYLPLDAFVFRPELKHIYIARDGRDVAWSLHNHCTNFRPEFYGIINGLPDRVGPAFEPVEDDVHDFYRHWFENDGGQFWSLWENVRSWWSVRDYPNVLMLHFNDLKRDLPGAVERIAAFLEVELTGEERARVIEHSTFKWMKTNAEKVVPLGGSVWEGGASTFINKGTNGRWQTTLTAEEVAAYDAKALAELGPECARWLAEGDVTGAGSLSSAA